MKKTRIWIYIILFLLLGLYVDIRNAGWYCNSFSKQPSIVVQTIIPFRAEREVFIIGYGEKINNFPSYQHYEDWWKSEEVASAWSSITSCIISIKKEKPYEGENTHYFDLKFWEEAK